MNDVSEIVWPRFCHPIEQAAVWVGNIPLYDWQIDVLIAAAQPHSRVVGSMANESGKTAILGIIYLMSVATTFRGAMCHATSGNEEQLRGQLFTLLKEQASRHGGAAAGWTVNESQMLITLPNDSTIRCSVKKDAESVEGFHGYQDPRGFYRPLAYFIDEAKHVSNLKEQAVRRIDPDFYLALSTPPTEIDVSMDWFWKGINYDDLERTVRSRRQKMLLPETHDARSRRCDQVLAPDELHSFPGAAFTYRRVVTWLDMPHLHTPLKKQERDNLIKRHGIKSAFIRSMLFGEATDGEVQSPIFNEDDTALMRRAMSKDSEFKPQHGDTRVGADVSGTGLSDPMVIGVRNGTEVLWLEERVGYDDIAQAEHLVAFCRQLNVQPYQCIIDGIGIGASICNRMEQTLKFHGITRFLSNNSPTFDFQFKDRYTELHWVIKDLLSYRVLTLPWCPGLMRDMRERRYVIMPGDKIKTEPKEAHRKRVGHSPDFLDLLVYLFSDFPIDKVRRGMSIRREEEIQQRPHEGLAPHFFEQQTRRRGIMPGLIRQPTLTELRTGKPQRKT